MQTPTISDRTIQIGKNNFSEIQMRPFQGTDYQSAICSHCNVVVSLLHNDGPSSWTIWAITCNLFRFRNLSWDFWALAEFSEEKSCNSVINFLDSLICGLNFVHFSKLGIFAVVLTLWYFVHVDFFDIFRNTLQLLFRCNFGWCSTGESKPAKECWMTLSLYCSQPTLIDWDYFYASSGSCISVQP